ncbi:group II intron maturase-specific domain-containing protein [Virgibacillus dokdonensis]|nr:group II intron maturase-specific domain-containing protein [Virgibacillus dokdonensis]
MAKLNRYLVGWLGYYQLAETPSIFEVLDSWMRMIRWKEWKKVKTKYKNLIKLGISKGKAWEWANTRKAYWCIAKSPILHREIDTGQT